MFLQNAAAPVANMAAASSLDPSTNIDIYGIVIPKELCEDVMAEFASQVNSLMESKFEVKIAFQIQIMIAKIHPCLRENTVTRSGTTAPQPLFQRF